MIAEHERNPSKRVDRQTSDIDKSRFRFVDNVNGLGGKATCDVKLGQELDISDRFFSHIKGRISLISAALLQGDTPDMQAFYNIDNNLAMLPRRVRELIQNSLDNFAEHQIDEGQIEVALGLEETTFQVSVSDNGTGIPDAEVDQIFRGPISSSKADNDSKAVFGGAGEGLYILKNWAIGHGGDVTYERLEQGSKFTFTVDTHAFDYPVEEIGTTDSIDEARTRIASYYSDQINTLATALGAKTVLTDEEKRARADVRNWHALYGRRADHAPSSIEEARRILNEHKASNSKEISVYYAIDSDVEEPSIGADGSICEMENGRTKDGIAPNRPKYKTK